MNKQLDTWQSDFGDAYTERNQIAWQTRLPAFQEVLGGLALGSVLEVGCNRGHNLACVASVLPDAQIAGVEPNAYALALAHGLAAASDVPLSLLSGNALALPFRDGLFDLVFTAGVLIHVGPTELPQAMAEVYRVSKRYVLAAEYYAETETPIEYRGSSELLWKRDFLGAYRSQFPDLQVVREGYWDMSVGFDRTHWWLLEKG